MPLICFGFPHTIVNLEVPTRVLAILPPLSTSLHRRNVDDDEDAATNYLSKLRLVHISQKLEFCGDLGSAATAPHLKPKNAENLASLLPKKIRLISIFCGFDISKKKLFVAVDAMMQLLLWRIFHSFGSFFILPGTQSSFSAPNNT